MATLLNSPLITPSYGFSGLKVYSAASAQEQSMTSARSMAANADVFMGNLPFFSFEYSGETVSCLHYTIFFMFRKRYAE